MKVGSSRHLTEDKKVRDEKSQKRQTPQSPREAGTCQSMWSPLETSDSYTLRLRVSVLGKRRGHLTALVMSRFEKSLMCICGGEAVEWRGTLNLSSPDEHQRARLERGSPISLIVWCSGDWATGSAAFHTTCCWACLYRHHVQSDNMLSRPRPKQQDKALRSRNRNASLSCLKSPTPENG